MITADSRSLPRVGPRVGPRIRAACLAAICAAGLASSASAGAERATESATIASALQPETVAPSADLPEAEEIFERYIEAIGGREKIEKIKNRRITGTYQGDPFEFRANVTVWWDAEGGFQQRVAEPAGLKYELFAVDDMTWSVIMDGEPTPMGGVQRQELLDTADFYGEANYKNRYKEIRTAREAQAGETPIYIVNARTHAGRPHTLFFDQETGLLIGNRVPVSGPNNTMRDMTVRIQNYKDIGGVLYPTLFIQDFGGDTKPNRYEFTEIKVNVDDGHEFVVPDSIREVFEASEEEAAAEENESSSED